MDGPGGLHIPLEAPKRHATISHNIHSESLKKNTPLLTSQATVCLQKASFRIPASESIAAGGSLPHLSGFVLHAFVVAFSTIALSPVLLLLDPSL